MNATEWVTGLLADAASVRIPSRVAANARLYCENGEGWLAAWDLLDAGLDQGWLTDADLNSGIALAASGDLSRIGDGLHRRLKSERERRRALRADSA